MTIKPVPLQPAYDVSRMPEESASFLVNMYAEAADGKGPLVLTGYPGDVQVVAFGEPVRGMICPPQDLDSLYLVVGSHLAVMRTSGEYVLAAAGIPGNDLVEMEVSRNQLVICAANTLRIWDFEADSTAQQLVRSIKDPDFAGASTMTVCGGYVVAAKPAGDQFRVSALQDGFTWSGTDFATAEGSADRIVAMRTVNGELWIFGTRTTEVWTNTPTATLGGEAPFPFTRRTDNEDVGCLARDTVRNVANTVMWLGLDRSGGPAIYRADGYTPTRVSTAPVERLLARASDIGLARAIIWRADGHVFYAVTCDAGTLVYDVTTNTWHQAATGSWALTDAPPPWSWTASAYFGNATLLGNYQGDVVRQTFDVDRDDDRPLVREFTTQPVGAVGQRHRMHRLEMEFERGAGSLTRNTTVLMSQSRDGGHTWEAEKAGHLGLQGQYRQKCYWTRLGMTRDRAMRFRVTDPGGRFNVNGLWADLDVVNRS